MSEFTSIEVLGLKQLLDRYAQISELVERLPQILDLVDPMRPLQPPTTQPVATLCEAVAGFLDRHDRFNISDENEDVTHTAGYWIEQMRHTLTAERKRAVLVDKVIQANRSQLSPDIMDAPCGCPCCEAIAALDAFDKGAENG